MEIQTDGTYSRGISVWVTDDDPAKAVEMKEQPEEITLTFEQKDGYLVFTFDEAAESAVSGGALKAVKDVWS